MNTATTTDTTDSTNVTDFRRRGARILAAALLCITAGTSAGCWPRQRIAWSPDGERAVVMSDKSTNLCDGEGKLARLDIGAAVAAAWLPNSRHVLLAVPKQAAKWSDLAGVLDETTRKDVAAAAGDFDKAVIEAAPGEQELPGKALEEITKKVFDGRNSLVAAALVYLRDNRPDALKKRLGPKWGDIEQVSVTYNQLAVYELDGMSLKPGQTVRITLKGTFALRMSPSGKSAACVTGSDRAGGGFDIRVIPLSPKAKDIAVAECAALYPDWSADGQYIAYIQSAGTGQAGSLQLGTLSRRRVADESGNLLAEMPKPEDLAGLLFTPTLTARCMADGRILFSAAEVTMPATTADMPQRASLFAYDPARPATLTRMIPTQTDADLPARMLFELSPDQKQIAVSGGDAKVCIVHLADGKLNWCQTEDGQFVMLPSWRKTGELCYAKPVTHDGIFDVSAGHKAGKPIPEVALWSAGETRIISKDWPEDFLKELAPASSSGEATGAPATTEGSKD